ncbi:MAG: Holliday junction branch migration DNA helicase RuvB [Candidatus Magasanikbacteria bacterium]|nr:Holliday junction branch migration DNA helicase RuvB [Candidatus Magasanikbacteria bacterium]
MPLITDEEMNNVSTNAAPDERVLENELRPRSLGDFIGQEHLKDSLGVFLQAAQQRAEPLDHVLLYGNPGLGKTTLANIIASEMGRNCKVTSGPTLEKVGDLAAILTALEPGDVLFIDEIHRLNRSIEEVLYPAMEDFAIDLLIGKGPGARTLRMQINKFTLIGATTRPSLISSPLRDRFGATFHLDFYTEEDMRAIIARSAEIIGVAIDDAAVARLAAATRRTPRVANRLLRRVRDVVQVENKPIADETLIKKTLDMLRVDHLGLDHGDRKILNTIIETFRGGPVGLSTLAAAVAEEMETLETVNEPYLLQIGFLERTPKGRCVTARALEHLGLPVAPLDTTR